MSDFIELEDEAVFPDKVRAPKDGALGNEETFKAGLRDVANRTRKLKEDFEAFDPLPEGSENNLVQFDGTNWVARGFVALGPTPATTGHLRITGSGDTTDVRVLSVRDTAAPADLHAVSHTITGAGAVFGAGRSTQIFGDGSNADSFCFGLKVLILGISEVRVRAVTTDALSSTGASTTIAGSSEVKLEADGTTVFESNGTTASVGPGDDYVELKSDHVFIGDTTAPSANPTDGTALSSVAGAPHIRTSDGVIDELTPKPVGTGNPVAGTEVRRRVGVNQTHDDSAEQVPTVSLSLGVNGTVVHATAKVTALQGDNVASFERKATIKRNSSGTVSKVGSDTDVHSANDAGLAGIAVAFAVSGTEIRVNVTGLDATIIDWVAIVEYVVTVP